LALRVSQTTRKNAASTINRALNTVVMARVDPRVDVGSCSPVALRTCDGFRSANACCCVGLDGVMSRVVVDLVSLLSPGVKKRRGCDDSGSGLLSAGRLDACARSAELRYATAHQAIAEASTRGKKWR